MRAIAVHEDVVVAIGAIWKTTCTAVRAGDEAFLIDSPILPDELEVLPALLDQAGSRSPTSRHARRSITCSPLRVPEARMRRATSPRGPPPSAAPRSASCEFDEST
jgi:hypothetical protein